MNQREVGAGRFRRLAGVARDSFRVPAKDDSTDPFAMFELSWGNCLGVLGGRHRTIGVVQNLAVVAPSNVRRKKPARVGIMMSSKSARPGEVNDLSSCIARQQDSRTLLDRNLDFRNEFNLLRARPCCFGNLGECPHIELDRIAIVEIEGFELLT